MAPESLLVQTDAAPLKSESLCQFIPAEDLVYGLGNKRERGEKGPRHFLLLIKNYIDVFVPRCCCPPGAVPEVPSWL